MFKMDRQKSTANNIRHENTQLEIKPIKTGTTYCLGCTTRSKITNKVLIEKSNCIVCRFKKKFSHKCKP